MTWGAAATIGSAVIGGYASNRAAKKGAAAQERAAELQYQQSLPWSTTGLFGGATFDEGDRTAEMTLSPELQAHYDRLMGRAGTTAGEVESMMGDPFAMQQKLYQQQKGLFAPQQEEERLALENRLRAQGMLGATGGQQRMGSLLEAQQQQDLARQVQSMDQAQKMIDLYRGREAGDISQALTLGELPLAYANLGRGIGTGMSPAAQYGAKLRSQGALNVADTQSAFWSQLGKDVGSRDWGGLFSGGGGADQTTIPSVGRSTWDDDTGMYVSRSSMPSNWQY